jgi:integrase
MKNAQQKIRFNAQNERMKYEYRRHMRRAMKRDEKTVISTLKHLRDYETFTDFACFSTYNCELADKYIDHLSNRGLSLSFINDNIRALRDFLKWLERQKGYRSKIDYNHIDYLNVSDNQRRTAKATEYKKSHSFKDIIQMIRLMPSGTLTEQRNKAIISLQALCGLRINELRTVKIKNLIEEDGSYFIYVNPKDMQVKFAKTRHANFMPLPDDIVQNVLSWRETLYKHGFTEKNPLFPRIDNHFSQMNLLQLNLTHDYIKSETTLRDVFKKAYEAAGLPYLRPHSFRHTITRYAERQSPEFLNAVRQSLGHSSIDTTFQSYGALSEYEQRRRISEGELIS